MLYENVRFRWWGLLIYIGIPWPLVSAFRSTYAWVYGEHCPWKFAFFGVNIFYFSILMMLGNLRPTQQLAPAKVKYRDYVIMAIVIAALEILTGLLLDKLESILGDTFALIFLLACLLGFLCSGAVYYVGRRLAPEYMFLPKK